MQAAAVLAVVIGLPLAVMAYPLVHNYHLAPLARLAKRVHVGDDCAATARAFAAYHARRVARGNTDVQYADQATRDDIAFQRPRPPRRLLHLYDLTPFHDVQLTAICTADGRRVEQVFYIGD